MKKIKIKETARLMAAKKSLQSCLNVSNQLYLLEGHEVNDDAAKEFQDTMDFALEVYDGTVYEFCKIVCEEFEKSPLYKRYFENHAEKYGEITDKFMKGLAAQWRNINRKANK